MKTFYSFSIVLSRVIAFFLVVSSLFPGKHRPFEILVLGALMLIVSTTGEILFILKERNLCGTPPTQHVDGR